MTPPNDAVERLRAVAELGVADGGDFTQKDARAILAHIATLTAERDAAVARADAEREKVADAACLAVAELPDRTSPDDWPEAMLVTHEELHSIVTAAIEQGSHHEV